MMKKVILILGLVTIMVGTSGMAHAVPVSFTDTFNAGGIKLSDTGLVSRSWVFDIASAGYDPSLYLLDTVTILTVLRDDATFFDFSESAQLNYDNGFFVSNISATGNSLRTITPPGANLLNNGLVDARITATKNDFRFFSATLTATGVEIGAPVPEPSTMILLGTGLVGLVGFSYRRKTQSA